MNKGILPLVIAILLILISIGMVISTDYSLDRTHYIGIAGVFVSLLLYFNRKSFYIVTFGLTLIAGLIGLLDIFYVNMAVGFGDFKFNPVFLALLILMLVFNRDIMDRMFPEKRK